MSPSTSENAFSKQGNDFNSSHSDPSKSISEMSKATKSLAHDAVNLVKENASQYYDEGVKQAKKFEKTIEDRIQKNPLQSLLIVAGVGLVLGALWNRR